MAQNLTSVARRLVRVHRLEAAEKRKQAKSAAKKTLKTVSRNPAQKAAVRTVRKIKPVAASRGLTCTEILSVIPPDRIDNAKRDNVTMVSFNVNKRDPNKAFSRTLTRDSTKKPVVVRPHRHWITKTEKDKPFHKSKLQVSCDCPDWMFTWEVAMTRHGASWIKYSNGDPPIFKNPRQVAGGCKHIAVLLAFVRKHRI